MYLLLPLPCTRKTFSNISSRLNVLDYTTLELTLANFYMREQQQQHMHMHMQHQQQHQHQHQQQQQQQQQVVCVCHPLGCSRWFVYVTL